ncbi:Acylphosphatase [Maioricimonas rarisocia]|uniref:acylphosphatase n=1 Tax=Maioricimonas rarisocia TaxID=2528026 RepID=A0A517ZFV2_9PLAN|nr:acylphosphatase [Maioricimonas rarisocia]QDU41355.1 Acylphosphatase [Maioricimonas rarisocia]
MTASCRHIVFRGRVQGVGFRYTASRIAALHGVSGWVRNQSDGTVELVAAGSRSTLERFLDDLQQAMQGYITATDESPCPEHAVPETFEIRR